MHILTFDIEHWYESWKMRGAASGHEHLPDCDTAIVLKLLDLLDETGNKATFFFTGAFAREFPRTAAACFERGHEVASHSDQHLLLTSFDSIQAIKADLACSAYSIAQATGNTPKGFRAPKWSVTPELEAPLFETLLELGMTYDSSFFPSRRLLNTRLMRPHKRALASGKTIIEVPATAFWIGNRPVPCGGAYFRLLPLKATQAMFDQCERRGVPAVFYLHPYDLNPHCHLMPGTGLYLKWMRKVGVKTAHKKLVWLLNNYKFTSMDRWICANGLSMDISAP